MKPINYKARLPRKAIKMSNVRNIWIDDEYQLIIDFFNNNWFKIPLKYIDFL